MDPASFHQAPRIQSFYPNYLSIVFYPIAGIEAVCEYWLPSSKIAAGRISLHNRGNLREPLKMEWVGLLNPMGEGEGMSVVTSEGQTYLKGWCGSLKTVCVLSGHPRAGSGAGPALSLNLDLPPGARREYLWAFATHTENKSALNLARETLNRRWDAEIAHLELLNASQMVEFNTHSEAWDAALAFSQKTAFSLFYSGNQHLPHPSFVLSRQPDHGFSLRGDGSDYPILWKGQTALDAYYLASLILPGGIDLMKGVLRNFLCGQEITGQINWRPSLAGGRSSRLAQPLLATLAWEIFKVEDDPSWIAEVYPRFA